MKSRVLNFALVMFTIIFTNLNANAATINVTTFNDTFNPEDGLCSLREAVIAANQDVAYGGCTAGSGDDTIVLQAGTYTLTRSCDINNAGANLNSQSDTLTDCDDLDIYSNLTVIGAGKTATFITVNSDSDNVL